MTDVWTSVGVVAGVGAVALTGWERFDPLIALAVAANIVWTGVGLVRRSMLGLLDTALPPTDLAALRAVLERYEREYGLQAHALRSRQAATWRFVSVHVIVPGDWTVQRGHRLLEELETDLRGTVPRLTVFTHLKSLDDPASWDDTVLDRIPTPAASR